jgi:hypothetical protein
MVCHEPVFAGTDGEDVVTFVEDLRADLRVCSKRMDALRKALTTDGQE